MTEQTQQQSTLRPSASNGMAWKSGLLGASLGAVLLGWGLLAADSAKPSAAPVPAQPQIIVVRVPVQNSLGGVHTAAAGQSLAQGQLRAANIAPLPQRPFFQQPVTRTRRS
jgi:hypothetical protein